ncbi:hypothetical protein P7C70_g4046, partial [Phenoliferia sp. Uapishka_3]
MSQTSIKLPHPLLLAGKATSELPKNACLPTAVDVRLSPILPYDVTVLIIENIIFQSNSYETLIQKTLAACCLVSRAFYAPAHEALFRDLQVIISHPQTWPDGERVRWESAKYRAAPDKESFLVTNSTKLEDTLVRSPRIAILPRALELRIDQDNSGGVFFTAPRMSSRVFNSIIRTCPSVDDLRLRGFLHAELLAITPLITICRPTLRKLSFESSLTGKELGSFLEKLPCLEQLSISGTTPLVDHTHPLPFHLTHLTVKSISPDAFAAITSSSHHSLRALTFDQLVETKFDLSPFHILVQVRLSVHQKVSTTANQILEVISSSPNILHLEIISPYLDVDAILVPLGIVSLDLSGSNVASSTVMDFLKAVQPKFKRLAVSKGLGWRRWQAEEVGIVETLAQGRGVQLEVLDWKG